VKFLIKKEGKKRGEGEGKERKGRKGKGRKERKKKEEERMLSYLLYYYKHCLCFTTLCMSVK
jgi:hypothetical protein